MRKICVGGVIFCLLFCFVGVAETRAQTLPDNFTNTQAIFSGNAQAPAAQTITPPTPSAYSQLQTGANAPIVPYTEEEGGFLDAIRNFTSTIKGLLASFLNIGIGIVVVVAGVIAAVLNMIAVAILEVAVFLFDIAVDISTNGVSQIVNGTAKQAIYGAWEMIRDLVNIGFVFILLYIAINFILSTDSSATKKLLSNTILAALLINFSFFFAAVVVDISNVLALQLVQDLKTQVGTDNSIATYLFSKSGIVAGWDSIKEGFGMQNTSLDSVVQLGRSAQQGGVTTALGTAVNYAGGSIMALLMTIVLIVVLIIASFMLISRTIALIFLLITSPIAFGGYVLPYTKKIAKEWWQSLVGHAFFLPAFLLFLLVAYKLIGNGALMDVVYRGGNAAGLPLGSTSGALFGSGAQGLATTIKNLMGVFIQYAIVIGFFIAALVSAKKLSSMGSDIVTKLSGSITSTVGGAAMGLTGAVGRNTVGWGANKLVKSQAVQDRLANRYAGFGNLALKGMAGVAGSSMDVRGSRAFSGVASATGLGGALGNAGGKGGFTQQLKNSDDAKAKFAKDVLLDANADAEKERFEKEQKGVSAAKRLLEDAKVDGDKDKIKAAQKRVYDAEQRVEERKKQYDDKKNSRRIKYATDIGNPSTATMKAAKWTRDFIGANGRSAAISSKILKEASKSKTDELLETLIKIEKDQNVQDRTLAKQAAKP